MDVTTRGRSTVGVTDSFKVQVDLHQGSALSPLLLNIMFDVLTEAVRENPPWCILYANGVVILAKSKNALQAKLERWRETLESGGLKISRRKTECMTTDLDEDQGATIQIGGRDLKRVTSFKYLGSVTQASSELEKEINHRIQSGWKNWRKITGVVCDKRVLIRLKGGIHKAIVRPALMYGLETVPIKKAEERKLDVAEMKMLRWMSGVTRRDKMKNEYIRGSLKVIEVSRKVQEARLLWYGHLKRGNEDLMARKVMIMELPGKRIRGRPKKRWKDRVAADMAEKGLHDGDCENRNNWTRLIRNSDPV